MGILNIDALKSWSTPTDRVRHGPIPNNVIDGGEPDASHSTQVEGGSVWSLDKTEVEGGSVHGNH